MIRFEDDKFVLISYIDIIPNTDLIVYSENGDLFQSNKIEKMEFEGFAVTFDYYKNALEVKNKYFEIKEHNDSVRSSDEQYEDPFEWSAYDDYCKYWRTGLWYEKCWNYR